MDKVYKETQKRTTGDLAIDGLIYGLVSGIVMAITLVLAGMFGGDGLLEILGRFSPMGAANPLTGLLSHLAVSVIYGLIFGALVMPLSARFPSKKLSGWLLGLVYGACLFLLAQYVILPGGPSALERFPTWLWGLGHGIYGLVLGGLFTRKASW